MPDTSTSSDTLPIGRFLRFVVGLGILASVTPFFIESDLSGIGQVATILVGMVLFYSLLHWMISSYLTELNSCLGATVAIAPAGFVFISGGPSGEIAAVTFIGASLLLAAARADSGCEVMSVPALLFGRRTHLVCLLFSPVDWVEQKIQKSTRRP